MSLTCREIFSSRSPLVDADCAAAMTMVLLGVSITSNGRIARSTTSFSGSGRLDLPTSWWLPPALPGRWSSCSSPRRHWPSITAFSSQQSLLSGRSRSRGRTNSGSIAAISSAICQGQRPLLQLLLYLRELLTQLHRLDPMVCGSLAEPQFPDRIVEQTRAAGVDFLKIRAVEVIQPEDYPHEERRMAHSSPRRKYACCTFLRQAVS